MVGDAAKAGIAKAMASGSIRPLVVFGSDINATGALFG